MEREDIVDHPDIDRLVEEARLKLAESEDKEAARLLKYAAYHMHDPQIEAKVRALAEQGRQRAGILGGGRWEEILRIADHHGAAKMV